MLKDLASLGFSHSVSLIAGLRPGHPDLWVFLLDWIGY